MGVRFKDVALRRLFDVMVNEIAYGNMDQLDHLAEKELTDREMGLVQEQMMKEVERFRDRLVKNKVILDGVPLPWELKRETA